MELRLLKYVLMVAQEANFTRAAEKLHLSQPTLSRQLKEMENTYGKELFIRQPRQILLTEDGLLLKKRAEEILALVAKTEKELSANDNTLSGDIHIGSGESVNFKFLLKKAISLSNGILSIWSYKSTWVAPGTTISSFGAFSLV